MNVHRSKKTRRKVEHEMPPVGTRLRGQTKGQQVFASIVVADTKSGVGILFDGVVYRSMSAAARAATGNSTDGWLFWKLA